MVMIYHSGSGDLLVQEDRWMQKKEHDNYTQICIPVVPHKAVAEVSKIGNL